MSFKPTMNGPQMSDRLVVPMKSSNEAERTVKEMMEGRSLTEGNTGQQNALRTQSREVSAPSALERVRDVARKDKGAKFTALLHHVTQSRLRTAFFELKKKAAPGVDGITWQGYSEKLDERIADLHRRVHRGGYRAKPSRRVFIPKSDGTQRPLGIASLEDKLVQRVVVDVMNAIYEEDFLGFSYGFRPGRSQHDALDALATGILRRRVTFVLDADIRGFFDAIDRGWLMKFVEHRIADKRLLSLLRKWLVAGVLEHGRWTETMQGSPQGATVSPLLANVFGSARERTLGRGVRGGKGLQGVEPSLGDVHDSAGEAPGAYERFALAGDDARTSTAGRAEACVADRDAAVPADSHTRFGVARGDGRRDRSCTDSRDPRCGRRAVR